MRVKLYIQISPSSLAYVKSDKDLVGELVQWSSFNTSKFATYIQLGEVEVDLELDTDRNSLAQKAVAGLRAEQANIRAKATKECNDLEVKVQQLLAIENKPTAPMIKSPMDEAYDLGYEVKQAAGSGSYYWEGRFHFGESPGKFDTPEEAAYDVIKCFGDKS